MEDIKKELERQGRIIDVLYNLLTGETKGEGSFLKRVTLAKKYGVHPTTIDLWLLKMEAAGFGVEVRKASGHGAKMINAAEFHEAFLAMDELNKRAA